MTLPQLKTVKGRIGDPLAIQLRFWRNAEKTDPWDLTEIGDSWLAELRYDPDQLSPAATFAIDDSDAATGSLTLTLDAGQTVVLKALTYSFDVKAIDTDTTLVTGQYTPSKRYTHDTGAASPTASTPVWIGDVILMGDATGSLTIADLFTGPQGPAGPVGPPVNIDDAITSTSFAWSSNKAKSYTDQAIEDQAALDAGNYVPLADLGVASGVATLDGSGAIAAAQVPSFLGRTPKFKMQFVDPNNGNDSNDGLSWGAAKATIAAAEAALIQSGAHRGNLHLSEGVYNIGTAGSSAAGFTHHQNVHVDGAGSQPWTSGATVQGGTEIRYLGTGVAWETAKSATDGWTRSLLRDVLIKNYGSGTIGLHIRNPQNGSRCVNVVVGGGPSDPTHNFVTNSILVESTDTSGGGSQYPGFFSMVNCWAQGGVNPWVVMAGPTNTYIDHGGIDGDSTTTVGFRHIPNPFMSSAALCDLILMSVKMELHSTGTPGAATPDPVGFSFETDLAGVTAIGCTAHNDVLGTKAAFSHLGAPTAPNFPRMLLLSCSQMNFNRWLDMPNLVGGAQFVGNGLGSNLVYRNTYIGLAEVYGRHLGAQNSVLGTGNLTLSAGWGSTASSSVRVRSNDTRFSITITPGGSGIAANPTITVAYAAGTFNNAPSFAVVARNDANAPTNVPITWVPSATGLVITFNGTPQAGQAVTLDCIAVG